MEVLQERSELKRALALHAKVKPRRVLEIGCWDGGTLREWLRATPPPQYVLALSLEHRQPEKYVEWKKRGTRLDVAHGDSNHPEMIDLIRENAPYDWAFIDGEHSYDYVKQDVATVLPLMRSGGVMLLHDITPDCFGEVRGPLDVFRELEQDYRVEAFQSDPQRWSAGIGVVYVDGV